MKRASLQSQNLIEINLLNNHILLPVSIDGMPLLNFKIAEALNNKSR